MATDNKSQDTQEQVSLLDQFSKQDDSWFGVKEETGADEALLKEVKGNNIGKPGAEATEIDKVASNAVKEEEEDEVTFFEDGVKPKAKAGAEEEVINSETEVADTKGKNKEKTETDGDDKEFFKTLTKEMKERGTLGSIELKDDEEVTEEKFFEFQDQEIENRVDETFKAFFEEMDEEGKQFLAFKRKGGRTVDFLATYNTSIDPTVLDEANESDRDKLIAHYVSKVEKLSGDDLTDRVKWLKESGRELAFFKRVKEEMIEENNSMRERLVAEQEEKDAARIEAAKKFNTDLSSVITETQAVGDFPFTDKDHKELASYMTKPTVKVGKNRFLPAFQADLQDLFKADTKEKMQKLALLGKLIKTDFDTSDLVKKTKTKAVATVQSKLQEAKTGVKARSGGASGGKTLADYIDG